MANNKKTEKGLDYEIQGTSFITKQFLSAKKKKEKIR